MSKYHSLDWPCAPISSMAFNLKTDFCSKLTLNITYGNALRSSRASRSPLSVSQYYIWSLKTIIIVRWGVHFEFNQPYKQIWDFKQQVSLACLTAGMLRQVILCTQKKQMTQSGCNPCKFDKWNCQKFINIKNDKK